MTKLIVSILVVLSQAYTCLGQETKDQWTEAEKKIVRLSPSAFPVLPRAISRYLSKHDYVIPQSSDRRAQHNVISGQFRQRGQTDWAVLASHKGISRILVFWNGAATNIARVAEAADRDYLQGNEKGVIGFSRSIHKVGRKYILDHHQAYGGSKLPPIRHEAIDDSFDGKASTVRYFDGKRWLALQGAD